MAKRVSKSGRTTSIVGLFDVHIPDHDSDAFGAALSFISDVRPHEIVLGGDFLELASCSSHGGDPDPAMLTSEIEAGSAALEKLQRASPKSKITYMEGNHETRLTRMLVREVRTLYGALTVPGLLDLRKRGIRWVPSDQYVRRGKLLFVHGTYATKHHAAKHLDAYGTSLVYGHTHRPQIYSRATATSSIQAAFGVGCLRSLDAPWLNGVPSGWAHGLFFAEMFGDGLFTGHNIIMADARFAFGGRLYG